MLQQICALTQKASNYLSANWYATIKDKCLVGGLNLWVLKDLLTKILMFF